MSNARLIFLNIMTALWLLGLVAWQQIDEPYPDCVKVSEYVIDCRTEFADDTPETGEFAERFQEAVARNK